VIIFIFDAFAADGFIPTQSSARWGADPYTLPYISIASILRCVLERLTPG
jgi:hypothetical protein